MGTWWFTSGFGGIEFSKPDGFGLDPYWMVLISGKLLIPFAAIFLCQPGQPQPFLDPAWQVLLGSLRLLKDTTRSAFFLNCSTLFLGGMLQRQALRQTLRKLRFLNQVLGGPANLELSRFEDTLTRVLNIHGKNHTYTYITLGYVTLRYITLHYIHTYTHTCCTLNSGLDHTFLMQRQPALLDAVGCCWPTEVGGKSCFTVLALMGSPWLPLTQSGHGMKPWWSWSALPRRNAPCRCFRSRWRCCWLDTQCCILNGKKWDTYMGLWDDDPGLWSIWRR